MNLTRDTYNKVSNWNLFELLERKANYSEYIEWTYEEHFKNLIDEILELQKEIEINWDIQWEITDVVYMVGQLLNKMNKDWILNPDFKQHKDKIIWRSPNLKQRQKVTRQIENENWYKLKSKQKPQWELF